MCFKYNSTKFLYTFTKEVIFMLYSFMYKYCKCIDMKSKVHTKLKKFKRKSLEKYLFVICRIV